MDKLLLKGMAEALIAITLVVKEELATNPQQQRVLHNAAENLVNLLEKMYAIR